MIKIYELYCDCTESYYAVKLVSSQINLIEWLNSLYIKPIFILTELNKDIDSIKKDYGKIVEFSTNEIDTEIYVQKGLWISVGFITMNLSQVDLYKWLCKEYVFDYEDIDIYSHDTKLDVNLT